MPIRAKDDDEILAGRYPAAELLEIYLEAL
jgi:hypothetical protein